MLAHLAAQATLKNFGIQTAARHGEQPVAETLAKDVMAFRPTTGLRPTRYGIFEERLAEVRGTRDVSRLAYNYWDIGYLNCDTKTILALLDESLPFQKYAKPTWLEAIGNKKPIRGMLEHALECAKNPKDVILVHAKAKELGEKGVVKLADARINELRHHGGWY